VNDWVPEKTEFSDYLMLGGNAVSLRNCISPPVEFGLDRRQSAAPDTNQSTDCEATLEKILNSLISLVLGHVIALLRFGSGNRVLVM
jgi:hypothetical protein